jgi:ABC-type sugar transport system ATPase subunit
MRCAANGQSYGRVRALENLSFSVAEGRFFVLFGPSSVGKTTTLGTIAGLSRRIRTVEIFGKD